MNEAKTEAVKAEKEPKIEQNGVTRPKAGTKTARVWEITDTLSIQGEAPAARKDVLEAAGKEGINQATAATQYGRWRKFYGLGKEVVAKPEAAEAEAAPSDVSVEEAEAAPSDVSVEEAAE